MRRIFLGVLLLCVSLSACKQNRNPYAIRDFSSTLQPCLVAIVTKGVADNDTAVRFIETHASDKELDMLSYSEHPLLRSVALLQMLERPSIDHYQTIMTHLDDTAMIVFDEGEWGWRFYKVSDKLLLRGRWKNEEAKQKTIEAVITKHNYLREAYAIAARIQPEEKYYPYIREMAQRDEDVYMSYHKQLIEAVYALAKFKKEQDIPLIKKVLIRKSYDLNDMAFVLLKEYPQETYREVFEKFYLRHYYFTFDGEWDDDRAVAYIRSIASYKNEWSAAILKKIWERRPFTPLNKDSSYVRDVFLDAIKENDCKAYFPWRRIIDSIERTDKDLYLPLIPEPATIDTTAAEPVHWR